MRNYLHTMGFTHKYGFSNEVVRIEFEVKFNLERHQITLQVYANCSALFGGKVAIASPEVRLENISAPIGQTAAPLVTLHVTVLAAGQDSPVPTVSDTTTPSAVPGPAFETLTT